MSEQPTPEAIEAVARVLDNGVHRMDLEAEEVLAFIRDAIHTDGPESDAIRETLGLRIDGRKRCIGCHSTASSEVPFMPHFMHGEEDHMAEVVERRVVSDWQETRSAS